MASPSKVVLVTGASRGIGLTIAETLARAGHRVFGTSRKPPQNSIKGFEMVPLDLQDDESVRSCAAAVVERAGRIDVLVNNAGFDLFGALEETSLAEFAEQVDTNFMGAVRMTKSVLPLMRTQGGGRIVNIGSLGGRIGLPMNCAYAASKFALEGFSESLRMELLPLNIYVSVIVPGGVATDTLDISIRTVRAPMDVYTARRAALVSRIRDEGKKSAVKPADVARAVQLAIDAHAPPLSFTVGGQAKWVPRMKALFPQALFENVMRRQFP